MDPEITLFSGPSFGFSQKNKFAARQSLAVTRGKTNVHPKPVPAPSVWNRKPPNFSPQFYTSSTILDENTARKKVNMSKDFKKVETRTKVRFPEVVPKKQISNFVCRFKVLDPFEAKILFVKNGKYASGVFKDSKPHDFRQYETNIPDFMTKFDRDILNLKFESKNVNIVHDLLQESKQIKDARSQSFITHKPQERKWDSELILRKQSWPQKSASYTRYRRGRGAYTALMDRVEEKLTKLWQKEQELQHKQPMNANDSARKEITQ
ncbi:uncharacterized protein si:dkey-30e9.6 [Chiloscyllium plagiosum]|uniref:uncharacterized protein si:dkey-30e9.6 n=1 Tax=Chiloscyllium plagiosum TaxID=36176 RepID=UPI001CB86E02|nr:uncharacterized protein si:dkey-30e9.6 [Chiloscyllium plagiosum]